ncbi:MAG: TetR/AcrR family transcriptional regulator [Gracilibacteraceae bacterium]|jgi:AcrR family transcriptional regulator|nr:TetR/AcrR family transcriptional regulator [Gracilibacteraceae bacterium]
MENPRQDTKARIVDNAVQMFSAKNYERVTMRDIAAAVGIKAASLYSHFKSKDDILTGVYELFEETAAGIRPSPAALIAMAETAPPKQAVGSAFFYFRPTDHEKMLRILNIAYMMSGSDRRSREFFQRHVFDAPRLYAGNILRKLVSLGRIEPLDIENFLVLQTYFCFGAILRSFTPGVSVREEWESGLNALLELIRSTEQEH